MVVIISEWPVFAMFLTEYESNIGFYNANNVYLHYLDTQYIT